MLADKKAEDFAPISRDMDSAMLRMGHSDE